MFLSEEGRLFWDVFIGFMVFLDLLIVPYDAASARSALHASGWRRIEKRNAVLIETIQNEPSGSSIMVVVPKKVFIH